LGKGSPSPAKEESVNVVWIIIIVLAVIGAIALLKGRV
jgi:hypothetical protein